VILRRRDISRAFSGALTASKLRIMAALDAALLGMSQTYIYHLCLGL
jgi:hypothetical protein